MIETCKLHNIARTGNGVHQASVLALDPPHIAWEGLLSYNESLRKIELFDAQQEAAKKKAPAKKGVMRG